MKLNSLNTASRVLLPTLEELGTARSLTVAIMLRYGDVAGILSLKTDPRHYVSAEVYFRDVQATSLLKKVRGLDVEGIDRRAAALKKWWQGEQQCYQTNERLAKFNYGGFLDHQDLAVFRVLRQAAKTIHSWIGPRPPNLDEIDGRFGPGATFSDRGRLTTVPDKITSTPTLTPSAKWYILPFLQTYWGRVNGTKENEQKGNLSWVRGNRFLTVPKTGLIDRAIAVEPAINVFYQLGLGSTIRRRLNSRAGWDLDRAQEIHVQIARESSVTREFATLDLSNASDTVSLELVKLLLPPAWFEELSSLRSPFTQVDGVWVKLEKFSSMGNGFTFELETLIFAALVSASLARCGRSNIIGHDFFVFGDDIIIPDDMSRAITAILNYCGFSLNEDKSFSGPVPFRESCGGDFFEGFDVRPFFLKELVDDPWQLFPDINGIRRSLLRLTAFGVRFPHNVYEKWLALLPSPLNRLFGPEDLGDIVLHWDESRWKYKWENGIRYFRGVRPIPSLLHWKNWRPDVVLASALYGVGDGLLGITPRDPLLSYKVAWVARS